MTSSIGVSKVFHCLGIDDLRHFLKIVHGIEIWKKRDRDPVISGDLVVSTNYYACFPRFTSAQQCRRCSANTGQINSGMARGVHVPKLTKRLFQQERSSGMRLDNRTEDES